MNALIQILHTRNFIYFTTLWYTDYQKSTSRIKSTGSRHEVQILYACTLLHIYIIYVFLPSICDEFQLIRDRALKLPETSEELMDMMKFTQEARTSGMVKLNERIKESKDRLAYLIDVYMFPAEDIELNCEVLTWPNRISPVFDENDEVCVLFRCLTY